MLKFHFVFADGSVYDVDNVTKIGIHSNSNGYVVKSGDEILTASLPISTTYLYTTNGNVTISGENLRVIEVVKQEPES